MVNNVNLSQADSMVMVQETTPLGGGASFIGTTFNVLGYTHIAGFAFSNVASATPNGIIIEQALQSADLPAGSPATSLVSRSVYAITAADIDNNAVAVQVVAPFARIIYVNGAAAQATFRMYFAARILRGL